MRKSLQLAAGDPFGPYMCDRCVGDADLAAYIQQNAISDHCDFCERASKSDLIAASAEEVVSHIEQCLDQEYEDAANMVPYESAEGGYQANTWSTQEVLEDAELEMVNEAAYDYIVRHLPDYAWVQTDFFSQHPFDSLRHGWESFADAVKHHTRYLFFDPPDDPSWPQHDEIRPEDMLDALGRVIRECGLVRVLPAGTRLIRVRQHSADDAPTSLAELGPPPLDRAIISNRMSPAGISMLYAAEDEATAISETITRRGRNTHFTVATLQLDSDETVIDFAQLPPALGVFAPGTSREERAGVNFARAFAREVSKPIKKDGREHIEYVPTQVVTEFLRFRFRDEGRPVHGIRYLSAKRAKGVNVAMFAGYDDLISTSDFPFEPTLRISLRESRRVPPAPQLDPPRSAVSTRPSKAV
jgi:hypothetical protein